MKNYLGYITIIFFSLISMSTVVAQNQSLYIIKLYEPLLQSKDLENKEFKDTYLKYDFSPLWEEWSKHEYKGFIGENYQRLRVKIFSVIKDIKDPETYYVYGKSVFRGEILSFQGTFNITNIKRFAVMHWGVDDKYKDSGIKAQGILVGTYSLFQDRCHNNAGYFEGVLSALWYIDSGGKLRYDDIENFADPFRNNQFVGTWKNYDGSRIEKCHWGDYRIPDSGDLDNRGGEFYPNKKYAKYGWQSAIDAYEENDYNLDIFNWNQLNSKTYE